MILSACPHAGDCGSCAGYLKESSSFYEAKERVLAEAAKECGLDLPCFAMVSVGDYEFRDRVDLTWHQGRLGFFHAEKKEIVDLLNCLQLSPKLLRWVLEFKNVFKETKIKKASIRLRVSPDSLKGLWLDCSHEETAIFLKESDLVSSLLKLCHIEVGQRFKSVIKKNDGSFGLSKERTMQSWFETFDKNGNPIPLNSFVASFTQTGVNANRVMVKQALELLSKTPDLPVVELFCGLGNFSFALASTGRKLQCYEVDELSLACFKKTLEEHPELKETIFLHELNLYQDAGLPALFEDSLLFVDPPRSGLKNVLGHILRTTKEKRPKFILYVSCFAPTLASDLSELTKYDYSIEDLRGFDQFPQGSHSEWGVLLKKN